MTATYATEFAAFDDAQADRSVYLALQAAARRSLARCRKTSSVSDRLADVRHYGEWADYCLGEMGRLSFS